MITTLYADKNGEIFDAPGCQAVARCGRDYLALRPEDLIPLPEGAELMFLPGRDALRMKGGVPQKLKGRLAVAAMLPVGYTRTLLPAYEQQANAPLLPLYGYTAAALFHDEIYVAAVKTADNAKWHPYRYNTPDLKKRVFRVKRDVPDNRLVEHLANCSLTWHCCTAQNLFYRRWEAGIPVSPVCNANCLGCISLQPSECCPAPQSRITFTPSPAEIAAIGVYHLSHAPDPIISFGQGCEGEPSLAAETIAAGITTIRKKSARGQININTNAGFTQGIKTIVDAGLNSMRVSIISAIPATYDAYYRAVYSLDDVKRSIFYAKRRGVYVSLNMLLFPGLNDRAEEQAAWLEFLQETVVDMIQLRNLNYDPDAFLQAMPSGSRAGGVKAFIETISDRLPAIKLGSFTEKN
ncbi:radical SAM protein [Sporomusa acidovorans]|uniref:Radical SAM core domain-containing protein n=1 Tax=Sporomusa acidovorans (strain ATCC 49682 / DSM 3132 / Mol) TaxID=1123286 RepID=A0ABZ3IWP8_SPOA4|nr:radical SAM protein [Sporomusa acidovorans]OZC23582.1 molybdenum cofactor biosynthesis protein A [Sporomusa acidovorans DSM 3132]SDE21612.1 Radical SAM superfamily protein [Sporomusa acidovorans]